MSAFEIIANISESFIQFGILGLMLRPKRNNIMYRIAVLVLCVLINSLLISLLDRPHPLSSFDYVLYILLDMLLLELFFEGEKFEKLSKILIMELAINISVCLTMVLIPSLLKTDILNTLIKNDSEIRIVSLIFAKLLQFLCSILLFYFMKRIEEKYIIYSWIPEGVMMLLVFFCSSVGIRIVENNNETINELLLIVFIVMLLAMNYATFAFILYVVRKEKDDYELKAFFEKIEIETNRYYDMEKSKEELKALRHEIRNSFIPVRELLKENQTQEAKNRFDQIYEETEEKLKQYQYAETGYKLIDAVLNHFLDNYSEEGLSVDYKPIRIHIGRMEEKSLASILVNLLLNVEEAMKNNKKKKVKIKLENRENFLLIMVANEIDESVVKNVDEERSGKQDSSSHGYGIKAIRARVKDENGLYNYYEKEDMFVTEIIIPQI
ncbi:MAG: GHKL domain-containing protein [Lachnospiraceae bacterium]|nr:GHKL domain-containing protein [Lachnospiraceae bacterium]